MTAGEQGATCCNRAEVRTDVDGVGAEDGEDADAHKNGGELAAQRDGQADPRLQSDSGTRFLDRNHQGKGEEREPQGADTELTAGLGIRPDPRGIVVRRSRDEPGPQEMQDALRAVVQRLVNAAAPCLRATG